jgi:hypothetical protein
LQVATIRKIKQYHQKDKQNNKKSGLEKKKMENLIYVRINHFLKLKKGNKDEIR